MLAAGVAREVARIVLPVGLYSSMYVTMNARSLMHFLSPAHPARGRALPVVPAAGDRDGAPSRWRRQWAGLMPLTHAAFNANGRVAP